MPTRRTFLATALAPLAAAQSATPVVDTHIHLFSPDQERFPYHPNATYRPEPASLADYSAFVAEAGIDHTIIVHLPIPETMQGRSLRPFLEGREPADWRKSIYYAYYENSWELRNTKQEDMADPSFAYFTAHRIGPHRGVRTARHKLIEYYSEGDYWELFDLQQDPNELNNIYGTPEAAEITEELKAELMRLRDQYRDV